MAKFAFFVELKANRGKEAEVEAFLKQGAAMAKAEAGIAAWYGLKEEEPGRYGIIDTFNDEVGRRRAFERRTCKGAVREGRASCFPKLPRCTGFTSSPRNRASYRGSSLQGR